LLLQRFRLLTLVSTFQFWSKPDEDSGTLHEDLPAFLLSDVAERGIPWAFTKIKSKILANASELLRHAYVF
jgi:hypothetical protein